MNFKYFKNYQKPIILPPYLLELQVDSYKRFLNKGLREILTEVFPVKDYTGKELELHFIDYSIEEPKHNEWEAKELNLSYEAPLRITFKLINKKNNTERKQEVFFGDFPLMTPRGTFVVNGVERVVVSQLIRSAGVIFTTNYLRSIKLHGAKVIPNRGAWIEFETDADRSINVRIDRKRKFPFTVLFKAFGLQEEEIKSLFKDSDNGEISFIEKTLKRDQTKNRDEALTEVYKHIKPGELATVDNAKQLIDNIFFNFERYDLSAVGRYKINKRLYPELKVNFSSFDESVERILKLEDFIRILKEVIRLDNAPHLRGDDIDHLGNRRIRAVGELLQNKIRGSLLKMERIIKDRMSTYDPDLVTISQLINVRTFLNSVKEFFTVSQLSQFMDQVNPLAELEHKRRISSMGPGGLTRERAGFEVRDVHPSFYGRICPIETSEGQNIGLISHLSTYARVNELGFIETPYRKVVNGKVIDEIMFLDAVEELRYNIAHAGEKLDNNGKFINEMVGARVNSEPAIVNRNQIHFMDVSSQQTISIATSFIPFLEHDDANRALMGSNMQRQAVACVKPQIPLVATGIERKAALDSGHTILAEESGEIIEVDGGHISVKNKEGKIKIYKLINFIRSNQYTCINQQPIVNVGQKVSKGEVLADSSAIKDGFLSLGQNLLVAFVPWRGWNFEDAIILSEKLVKEDRFSSIHIEYFTCDVKDTKLGPEITTPDIPNVGEEKLKNLDEEGIVRIGAEVRAGDILVGKISPKGESDLTPEEKLLKAIFGEKARDIKDTSLTLSHGKRGRIVGIKIFSREKGDKLPPGIIKSIQVDVAQFRRVMVGDKLAGRHGNKGVISIILPEQDMPYLADGTPVDIVLNPLGVASRMNIGQILETHLGWAANELGYTAITPALAGATEDEIHEELKKAKLPEDGKVVLYDGYNGEAFKEKVTVGYIYIMKLQHLVEDKVHMRSVGPYSLITQQPLSGKARFGGQRFGEMEVWALEGYGTANVLQEMITIKSDDVFGRSAAYESIIRGERIKSPNIPASFNVLMNELKALGLNVELVEEERKKE